ncbi:MAG: hypothetical protein V7K50_02095 [Nostoc sp.]|uniref:hypothetical protein n=1 Tax=Nostoc sp. TaxID=1180 RepID=UPI002FF79C9A
MRIGQFNAIVSSSHVRLVYCRARAIATTVYFFYYDVYDGLFGDRTSHKLVLLTRNHRDLGKVPGLLIEIVTV